MMGKRRAAQKAWFYALSLEGHVPDNHLLRAIDRLVDLESIWEHLRPYYSETGRPSIDRELMIRTLIVGYCFGIRSERRLCEEVVKLQDLIARRKEAETVRLVHLRRLGYVR